MLNAFHKMNRLLLIIIAPYFLSYPTYSFAQSPYMEATERNCQVMFERVTREGHYGYEFARFVGECQSRGFWHSEKPADPRYKNIWVLCVSDLGDHPSTFAFWSDDQGPREMDVSSGGSSGTLLSDKIGAFRLWQRYLGSSGHSPKCYGFDNKVAWQNLGNTLARRGVAMANSDNFLPDGTYTFEQAKELYLASNAVTVPKTGSRNPRENQDNDKGYGYCTFQDQNKLDSRKHRAFVSDVFEWNFQKGESPDRAWDTYLSANYDITGFGECFHNFNTNTYDETVTERDRTQARFRSIYSNVIATGWRWKGGNR